MKKTVLNQVHRDLGARMVEFGGWDMPVQYTGVIAEHLAVRSAAGLFDVSHMGEFEVSGPDAFAFLQYASINDLSVLVDGQVQYSALCYPDGGIVDDITLYRFAAEKYMLCVNAANIDKDFAWLQSLAAQKNGNFQLTNRSADYAQLALQGPTAAVILSSLTSADLLSLKTYHFCTADVAGLSMLISRTGYTGEDGFELYCQPKDAESLWQKLMEQGTPYGLVPVGLGARDTLRLEKAYALYGHELSAEVLPLEARLGWITKLEKSDFCGRSALLKAKSGGIRRQLIGLRLTQPGVPREQYVVRLAGRDVGVVTSGTMSPSSRQGIALALVDTNVAASDESFSIVIRGREVSAEKVKLPFV
ncbi:glycine cleavage system aminomethyltransferase GcvT [Geopsychrobacter electrodiphilus]|uniref:glycine cleavage system aminomethyltransferase GcvT n=1 Tax=Geopsychrobacter electrodiphilus TaxID=225196 RepID=UPI0005271D3C|nr:glycine cleavage system aminomethyltransferase GcvT [Geopsychrobacter electrodiphilus]